MSDIIERLKFHHQYELDHRSTSTMETETIYKDSIDAIEQLQEDKEKIINQFIETKEYYRGRLATEDKRYEEQSATTEQLQGLIRNATIESVRESDFPLLKEIWDSAPPKEETNE